MSSPTTVRERFLKKFGSSPDNEDGFWIPDTTSHMNAMSTSWEDVLAFIEAELSAREAGVREEVIESMLQSSHLGYEFFNGLATWLEEHPLSPQEGDKSDNQK